MTSTSIGTSTIFPINGNTDDGTGVKFTIDNILYFEDFQLNINNPISLTPLDKELDNLIGLKVIETDERKEEAELVFENGYRLVVNMRDEVYYGPEAMSLNGPNGFCVVWN